MKPFRFCPACATPLDDPEPEGGSTCPACGRSWYRNSAPTAGAAIVRGDRVLLSKRARDPFKGRFDVPGGFLLAGEHPVVGLKREVGEELRVQIDVSVDDCVSMATHTYGDEGDFVLALGFVARLVSGEPSAGDDVADIAWANRDEVVDLEFAWEHDRELAVTALEREE